MYKICDVPLDDLREEVTLPELRARLAGISNQRFIELITKSLDCLEAMMKPGDVLRRINRRNGGVAIVREGEIVIAVGFFMS